MNWTHSNHQQFKQQVVAVYDRAAATYDRVGARFFSYFGALLVRRLALPEGAAVLDVATGRGALLFPSAESIGSTGRAIGIDLSPAMVGNTAHEMAQRRLNNCLIVQMDADQIGFAKNTFDYVLCGSALFFLNYEQALLDFKRLLKPTGCLAAWVPVAPDDPQDAARWRWLSELTTSLFPGDFVPLPSWTASRRLNRPELLEAALREAGYGRIQINKETVDLVFADEQDWWDWEWSQAPRFILEAMAPEALSTFKTLSIEGVKALREPDGIHAKFSALLAVCYSQP